MSDATGIEETQGENNMAGEIVQLSIRIEKDIRQQVKIMALKKDTTVNDLVTEYIIAGLAKETNSK